MTVPSEDGSLWYPLAAGGRDESADRRDCGVRGRIRGMTPWMDRSVEAWKLISARSSKINSGYFDECVCVFVCVCVCVFESGASKGRGLVFTLCPSGMISF